MDKVRFGVIGAGGMGAHHASYISSLEGAVLTAICDADLARVDRAAKGMDIAKFTDHNELLASGKVDAVLIATPHYFHCEIARAAFERGIHVLSEKPQAVSVNDARKTNAAWEKVRDKVKYGMVLQMRTNPMFKKVRELIHAGELGEITRITWIVTTWFRTNAYYASGGWRATWAGEGGGVLINQCPHNLDLLQWVPDMMPNRVTAVGFVGKRHPIEVEDEVSAILEYPNGAIGHFISTTGEAPGTDRLEICGDRGRIVIERGQIAFSRTRRSVKEITETSTEPFTTVETWDINIPYAPGWTEGHRIVAQAFVNAILRDEPMIADGPEATKSLELGNAMAMSGLLREPVELPLDGEKYDQFLKDMAGKYGGKKALKTRTDAVDVSKSFH
jgi:predicted dehydrogenase